jgi:group I intron endonuclease
MDTFLGLPFKLYYIADMKSGIYIILNLINGKFYLGSSKNLRKRKLTHFQHLKKNVHHCIHMQRAFNKYGEKPFIFIEMIHCENYKEVEQSMLDKMEREHCYNVSSSASGGFLIENHPEKERIIAEATERLRKVPKPKPRFGEDNPNWRGGISVSYCSCGNKKNLSALSCTNCRDRASVNNPFYGKKHSENTLKRLSESKKGKYYGPQEKAVSIEGREFKSLSEAARQLSANASTLLFRIKSLNSKFKNYFYK